MHQESTDKAPDVGVCMQGQQGSKTTCGPVAQQADALPWLTVEVCLQAQAEDDAGRKSELEQEGVEDAHVVLQLQMGMLIAGR